MFIKNGKNLKVLYSGLTAEQMQKANLKNLICQAIILVGVAAVCLIPQDAAEYFFAKYSWFGSVNIIVLVAAFFVAAFCFVRHFRAYKIRESLTSAELPQGLRGSNKTFSGLEIQAVICVLLAVYELALTVLAFSFLTALCAVIAVCVATCGILVRITTFKAYSGLTEKKPEESDAVSEEIEDFYGK